jgi:hypothetical protein
LCKSLDCQDRLNGKNIRTKTHHAGTSEGARLNGEGIGEILPRSDVLGLDDEATWQVFMQYTSLDRVGESRENTLRSGLEISSMQERGNDEVLKNYYRCSLLDHFSILS